MNAQMPRIPGMTQASYLAAKHLDGGQNTGAMTELFAIYNEIAERVIGHGKISQGWDARDMADYGKIDLDVIRTEVFHEAFVEFELNYTLALQAVEYAMQHGPSILSERGYQWPS